MKDLLEFIEDDERVRTERKHAKKVKDKMTGISGRGNYPTEHSYSKSVVD